MQPFSVKKAQELEDYLKGASCADAMGSFSMAFCWHCMRHPILVQPCQAWVPSEADIPEKKDATEAPCMLLLVK